MKQQATFYLIAVFARLFLFLGKISIANKTNKDSLFDLNYL